MLSFYLTGDMFTLALLSTLAFEAAASTPKHCPPGKFMTTEQLHTDTFVFHCHMCSQGKYQGHSGTKWHQLCFECPTGKYSTSLGNVKCDVCAAGQYMTQSMAQGGTTAAGSPCKPCEAGRASPNVGAHGPEVCEPCAAGMRAAAGSASCVVQCSSGQRSTGHAAPRYLQKAKY